MLKNRARGVGPRTSTLLFAFATAIGTAGGGCSGGVTPGPTDGGGGGDGAVGVGDGGGGCTPADCAGLAAPAIAMLCPDGSSVGATLCTRQASGRCDWGFPACPADGGGTVCPGLGCAPQCSNGVLKDANGCDTCTCAPAPDGGGTGSDGGACVSTQGGRCGGNTTHPCTCASGLTCTPGDGGLPFGDVGGTCQ
jgi:hypothetical protein